MRLAQVPRGETYERRRAARKGDARRGERRARIAAEARVQREQRLGVHGQPLAVIAAFVYAEAPKRPARIVQYRDGAVGDDRRAPRVRDAGGGARERDRGTRADLPGGLEVLAVRRGVEGAE